MYSLYKETFNRSGHFTFIPAATNNGGGDDTVAVRIVIDPAGSPHDARTQTMLITDARETYRDLMQMGYVRTSNHLTEEDVDTAHAKAVYEWNQEVEGDWE